MAFALVLMERFTKPLRILAGYRFFLSLLVQGFFLHPCYQSSSTLALVRLALMPITIWLAITSLQVRQFEPVEEFFHINIPIVSFPTFHSICLAIEFGLYRGSVLEGSKCRAGNIGNDKERKLDQRKCHDNDTSEINETTVTTTSLESTFPSFGERIKFLVWLIFSPRGLQTSWAPPTSVVPVGKQMSMRRFVLITLFRAILEQLFFTAFWAIGASFAQSPSGVYGYLTQEMGVTDFPMLKEISPILICVPFSASAIILIDMLGCFFNLSEALLYHVGPKVLPSGLRPGRWDSTLYPPLFNEPWNADSLISFWSRGWHTIFRQHIVTCGYAPLAFLFESFGKDAARMAGLMGAMTFSGVFHEFVLVAASRLDPNFPTAWVFVGNGIGMVAETVFKKITGRKVGGFLGQVWFCGLLGILGRPAIESWIERGLGRGGIPPPQEWSRLRLLVPFGPFLPEKWLCLVSQSFEQIKALIPGVG